MKGTKRIRKYMSSFDEVMHTTLNPKGPGAVRIHLIPPIDDTGNLRSSVAIINGQDIVPVNYSWAIILNEFIKCVNLYDGRELTDSDVESIMDNCLANVRKVFPFIPKKVLKNDIRTIMKAFTQIAYRQTVDTEIQPMNIGQYAPYMRAPHRMDIMVSAMTRNGNWHCNQKCVHCYACGQQHADEEELSTDEWKSILDKCRKACISQITFTGGEPTMREDLFELIKYARWFVTRLNTNGIKLTKDYCEKLSDAELDSVQITFYSSDENIHNALVGANMYDKTLDGIKNAVAAGLSVSINTPLCKLNRDYVSTLKMLNSLGIRYVTCSGLITTGNATTDESKKLQLSPKELKIVLEEAIAFCHESGMDINFTSPGWIDSEFFIENAMVTPNCGACLSNMAITPGGNVVPCQSWLSEDVLGNMLNDSWSVIWNSEKCRKRRTYSSLMTGRCPLQEVRK